MAKGKGKKGKRRGDDSDDSDGGGKQAPAPAADDNEAEAGLSRKQKLAQKRAQKKQQQQSKQDSGDDDTNLIPQKGNDYGSDSEGEDAAPPPVAKKLTKKQIKRQKEKEAAEARAKAEAEAAMASDSEEENESEEEEEEVVPQPVRKGRGKKGKQQQQQKQKNAFALSDSESEEEEQEQEQGEIPQPVKKGKQQNKGMNKNQSNKNAFALSDSDSEKEESEEEEEPPAHKLTKKQLKKQQEEAAAKAAIFGDDSSDEEDDVAEEMEELVIDDEKKKKKKDKKKDKKKSKLEKKMDAAKAKMDEEKKAHGVDSNNEDNHDNDDTDDEAKEKAKRKAEKAAKKARKAEKEAKKLAKLKKEAGRGGDDDDGDEGKNKVGDMMGDGEDEVMYGAPDDKAWTDSSLAMKEQEKKKGDGPDLSLLYDENGKKLSNKERKKLIKAREAAARAAEYEIEAAKASEQGAQFACSQTAVNENDPQWQNSLDINIPSFNISAAGKILFKDAEFNIAHGRRYGLVGPNGKGKSTLLKMIASNDLVLPPRVDFLYVEQEVQADDTPAVEAVLKADKVRWNLLEEEKKLGEAIDEGDENPKTFARLQAVLDELIAIGAASAEAKARRILFGLGFDGEMQTKPTKMFSGGWRMRISLARALFIEPTLLMLDEPTNHLDLDAVIWLDNYLLTWKKTLLIVSHDQDFLNSVCDEILHIEDLKLASYKGNYDSFKKAEKAKVKQNQKAYEKQEKRLKELKRQGQSKNKATETVKKNKREPGARSKKNQNAAIASGQETATLKELIKRPREYEVKISFSDVAELSRPVMEVNNVFFRYTEKHPVIFDCIDFGIDMDSRICIVGPNGAGKSTLLKLLTGEIQPVKGAVKRNPRLRMGIYNQHFVDRLPMGKTPVEHLRDRYQDEDYQSIRNRLGKYGLEGHAHEVTMRDLSGGQKARVVFVDLSLQRPHILLLDEPTNNLDIETIDALIMAINEFNGGIVCVTHDQRLIDDCDCELWVVEEEDAKKWPEGFEGYKDRILTKLENQANKEEQLRNVRLEAAAKEREEKLARFRAKMQK